MLLTTCMVDFFFCNIGLTSCITAKQTDRKITRLNSSHVRTSRMPSSA